MKEYQSKEAMQAEYELLKAIPEECMSLEDMLEFEDLYCALYGNMTPEDVIEGCIEDAKQNAMEGYYD